MGGSLSDQPKPAPLTSEDVDLRDFDWMPLDVGRLRDSDLVVLASGDAFRAAVLLWCAAWHQSPAGSLPTDDRLLANLAGYGRDIRGWASVRADALRGFVECSDGRLYHPLVCQKAIEANDQRKRQQSRTLAATAARRGVKRNDQRDDQRDVIQNDNRDVDRHEERNEVQQTRPDQTVPKNKNSGADAPAPAARPSDFFERFKEAYPRRDGAQPWKPAEKKFIAMVKTGVDPEEIIAGAVAASAEARRNNSFGTPYVPQAVTWLNQQRWTDHATDAALVAKANEAVSKMFRADADSDQLRAWDEHLIALRGKGSPRDRNGGWYFETEWPPGYDPTAGQEAA